MPTLKSLKGIYSFCFIKFPESLDMHFFLFPRFSCWTLKVSFFTVKSVLRVLFLVASKEGLISKIFVMSQVKPASKSQIS